MMYTNTRHFLPAFINTISCDETYHGIWWLPTAPDDKVSGVLYLKKVGGVKLHLIGSFKNDFANGPDHSFVDHEVINSGILTHYITDRFYNRSSITHLFNSS